MRILSEHVCPLPPCPLASKERGGVGDTDMELAGDGSTPPLPLPLEGGRMDPSPPQPSRIVTKASISPRPNSHNSHSYPPQSDSWSERGENRIYSHAPFPTPLHSVGFEREMPGDHSRAALDRQGFHGSHPIPVDCLQSRGNDQYSPPRNPARPLSPDRQLPARDRRSSSSSPRSDQVESKRFITKALCGTMGNARSPMSNNSSPMPMLTSTSRSPVHTTPHGLGTRYRSPWTPRGHGTRCTIPVNTPSATTRPGSRTQARVQSLDLLRTPVYEARSRVASARSTLAWSPLGHTTTMGLCLIAAQLARQ